MNDDLQSLLVRQLDLGETHQQRAQMVLKCTPELSQIERIVEILICTVKDRKLAKPPHRPHLIMEFAENHNWLWVEETRHGDVIRSRLGEGPVFDNMLHYAWLIEEMAKRGGDLAAARAIVKTARLDDGRDNIWYHPPRTKEMTREQAAAKIKRLYQHNRERTIERIRKQLSKQFGERWIILPSWAAGLKLVRDMLPKASPRKQRSTDIPSKGVWNPELKMFVLPMPVGRR